jgi:hypothetical protein
MLAYRTPAYVGVGGVGGAIASALLQAVTRPLPGPLPVASGGPLAPAVGPQEVCLDPQGVLATGFEGWLPSNVLLLAAGLGAFLLIFSFVLGVILGGCGGCFLGYLWSAPRRSPICNYGWPRVAGYLRPPSAA